jgi:GDPmannose 4,6-dehydratase
MGRRALITGISGQDGAYLAKFLLEKGYEVHGAHRWTSSTRISLWRLSSLGIADEVKLSFMDILELSNVMRLIEKVEPDEIYNLAAQSFVSLSFDQPIFTSEVNALGAMRILEAIRVINPGIKYYQASTSEMFGKTDEWPQTEKTAFYPRSPYGVAKVYAHWATVNYRESHGIHACSGILFNHESPLRSLAFVTRKITGGFARIVSGGSDHTIPLGNLEPRRDWGYAGDYVRGMWLMLQHEKPDDYVLATGQSHSVRDLVNTAARAAGIQLEWEGEGQDSVARDRSNGRTVVRVDPKFIRPAEVDHLVGCADKARTVLGWEPTVDFDQLIEMMVKADMELARTGHLPI